MEDLIHDMYHGCKKQFILHCKSSFDFDDPEPFTISGFLEKCNYRYARNCYTSYDWEISSGFSEKYETKTK